jgi:hypothetical protein
MLGKEIYFKDFVHPLPLPGGRLHGNILLQELKIAHEMGL